MTLYLIFSFGIDTRPAVIQNVACLNYQLTLFQCNQSSPITNPLCTDNNDIGLSCCKIYVIKNRLCALCNYYYRRTLL